MRWFRAWRVHQRREPRIEFLGEQDGEPERDLKQRLTEVLSSFPTVRRGYLARVGFAPSDEVVVALCLASDTPDPKLVDQVEKVFRTLFAKGTFLDILFLSAQQEVDVARVCSAFFERAV